MTIFAPSSTKQKSFKIQNPFIQMKADYNPWIKLSNKGLRALHWLPVWGFDFTTFW